jgi:hypothetical protein
LLNALLLEADLVFELLDALVLEVDNLKQLSHQGRAFGLRDVGHDDQHGPIRPTDPPICPGFLRSYRQVT